MKNFYSIILISFFIFSLNACSPDKKDSEKTPEGGEAQTPEQSTNDLNNTNLHDAAKAGNIEEMKSLIEGGADLNAVNMLDYTPLVYAAGGAKSLQAVQLLIEKGAHVNKRIIYLVNHLGGTAEEIMTLLNAHNVDAAVDTFQNTALHKAAEKGDVEEIRSLIEKGATVNLKNDLSYTALDYAVGFAKSLQAVKILVENGAFIFHITLQRAESKGTTEEIMNYLKEHQEHDYEF